MRRKRSPSEGTPAHRQLFLQRLEEMIDMRHSLVRLAGLIPWDPIANNLAIEWSAPPTAAGRPAMPLRLMVGLLYLKNAFNLSDEAVCERWLENLCYQWFCGKFFFQTRIPCDPMTLMRFRQQLGVAGVDELLAQTIEVAKDQGAVKRADLETVIIDSSVQEKAVAYPTDSRLFEIARRKLVLAAARGVAVLRQSHTRIGKHLLRKAGGYAHANQFKRLRRTRRTQRTILGRVICDIEGKADADQLAQMATLLERARRFHAQRRTDKNKLYALHAPEVECIGKGKARQPYEFGVKVGIAISAKAGLIIGARAFPGNPYDGHTLPSHVEQAEILSGVKLNRIVADLGYRGQVVPDVPVIHRGRYKYLTPAERKLLKRRQAVEPTIGYLKEEYRMRRYHWK
jgi:IS5 family transposase